MIALCGEAFAQLSLSQDQEEQTAGVMPGQVASLLETQISKEKREENAILVTKIRRTEPNNWSIPRRQVDKVVSLSLRNENQVIICAQNALLCSWEESLLLQITVVVNSLHQALLITSTLPALNQAHISFLLSFIALPSFSLLVQNVSRNIIKLSKLLDSCNLRTRGAVDI